MKKFLTSIQMMAILFMAVAVTTACSSNDDNFGEEPTGVKTYTMTVSATKGSDAATRSLSIDGTGALNATWTAGEAVTVYNVTKGASLSGTLTAQTDGASTTLTGKLTGTIDVNDELTLKFLSPTYATQDGTLTGSATSIDKVCDYAEATVTVATVSSGRITTTADADFVNKQAIVKFSLKDKADHAISATAITVTADGTAYAVTPSTAMSEIYVAIPVIASKTVALSATVGSYTYTYEKTDVTLTNGQYYTIGVKMARNVNLSTVSADLELQDGDIVTGTLNGATQKYMITIAAGATVTLSGATINGVHTDDSHELWAGLTCLGNATIILVGTNAVQNFNRHYPSLQPGPTGTTLTISGTGSLTATNHGVSTGIGTNDNGTCGNIRIEGGTVTATGNRGAGIGSGYNSTCGDITITGGTVTATGNSGAGIGSGNDNNSKCGNISIEGGTVIANGGGNCAGIGSGENSTCGNISISGSANVTAVGGDNSAGIGTGAYGRCGSISISGGNVTATGSGRAAGIGLGFGRDSNRAVKCGDISITKGEGFVSVTAIRGDYSRLSCSIGTPIGGNNTSYKCGRILFSRIEIFDGGESSIHYSFAPDLIHGNLRLTISTTYNPNDTWTLTPSS